ncbi:MAG: hypothetical protein JKP90_20560 [Desulfofustis sp. PB-SRB1]|nr:hypothetical protein [Desulfofustis sp. PB-SRB1]
MNHRALFIYGLLAALILILIRGFSRHVDGMVFAVLLGEPVHAIAGYDQTRKR